MRHNDFDEHFNNIQKNAKRLAVFGVVATIFSSLVWFGVLGFVGWVVVKILQYNGIV